MTQILTRSHEQQAVVARLADAFNVDPEKILFLNKEKPLEPWLNYKALVAIARQSGEFKQIAEAYVEFIPAPMSQVVHTATVVNLKDQAFTRSGVAGLGEKLPNQEVADEHDLAGARALRAALDDAGFDPTKAAPVLDLKLPPNEHAEAQEAQTRLKDLARIHILAAEKGLTVPYQRDPEQLDRTGYLKFVKEKFGAITTADMGPADRARVIHALTEYEPPKAAAA